MATVVGTLRDAGFEAGAAEPLTVAALDTFDGRLHRAGLALEAHGAPPTTTLVLRDRAGDGPVAALALTATPRFADQLPPGPFRDRVAAATTERALRPVLTITGRRTTAVRRDSRGKVVVTVHVNDGLGGAGAVEIMGERGHAKPLARTVDLLRSLGMQCHDAALLDWAAAAAGVDLGGWQGSPTVALDASMPLGDALGRVLRHLTDAVDANVDGAIDDVDPEFLHDLRVAVRRTRSVLGECRRVLPVPADDDFDPRSHFTWLATVTSTPRDLDVYLLEWDAYARPLAGDAVTALEPVRLELAQRRELAHAELAAALRSDRFASDMRRWRDWIDGLSDTAELMTEPVGPFVRRLTRGAQRRVLNAGRVITPSSPAEQLHDLRKLAKRLRYLLECFGGLMPSKRHRAFVKRLAALQNNLGVHQDAEVHAAVIRSVAADMHARGGADPTTMIAVGQLVEQLDRRCMAARAEFADRFDAYDTSDARRQLESLLDPLRANG